MTRSPSYLRSGRPRRTGVVRAAVLVPVTVCAAGLTVLATAAQAAAGCAVAYTVTSQWQGGFVADVKVTNLGDPLTGWTATWQYGDGQRVTSAWNATVTQNGTAVTAAGVEHNRALPTGGSQTFGVQGTWTGSNGPGVNFALNGTSCTGQPAPTTSPTRPASPTPSPTRSPAPTASPTPTGGTAPTPTPPTGSQGNAAGLVGFATMSGHGRTGTNGGAGGATVTVTNYAQLAAAVADDVPRIVRVSGTITGTGAAMLDVGSNKTIIGVGANATISGFGLDVNGWGAAEVAWGGDICDPAERDRFTRVQNVIIQNLSFRNSADDSVNVQCYSHHVWINHNTFYPAADGSVDIKRGSDLVTVSRNRFVGTDKSMLLGHSDNNAAQDTGYLRATYHHNWFDRSNTRHPRVRFGYAHVFGNHVDVTDYFIGLGVQGRIYADSNYVKAAKTITQNFDNASLTWTASNYYNTATITRANSSGSVKDDWLYADGRVAAPPYSYSAGSAPASPPSSGAGVSGADVVPR